MSQIVIDPQFLAGLAVARTGALQISVMARNAHTMLTGVRLPTPDGDLLRMQEEASRSRGMAEVASRNIETDVAQIKQIVARMQAADRAFLRGNDSAIFDPELADLMNGSQSRQQNYDWILGHLGNGTAAVAYGNWPHEYQELVQALESHLELLTRDETLELFNDSDLAPFWRYAFVVDAASGQPHAANVLLSNVERRQTLLTGADSYENFAGASIGDLLTAALIQDEPDSGFQLTNQILYDLNKDTYTLFSENGATNHTQMRATAETTIASAFHHHRNTYLDLATSPPTNQSGDSDSPEIMTFLTGEQQVKLADFLPGGLAQIYNNPEAATQIQDGYRDWWQQRLQSASGDAAALEDLAIDAAMAGQVLDVTFEQASFLGSARDFDGQGVDGKRVQILIEAVGSEFPVTGDLIKAKDVAQALANAGEDPVDQQTLDVVAKALMSSSHEYRAVTGEARDQILTELDAARGGTGYPDKDSSERVKQSEPWTQGKADGDHGYGGGSS